MDNACGDSSAMNIPRCGGRSNVTRTDKAYLLPSAIIQSQSCLKSDRTDELDEWGKLSFFTLF